MFRLRIFLVIFLIATLVLTNVFTLISYRAVAEQLSLLQGIVQRKDINDRVLNFAKLFVEQVLGAKGGVSFANRLKLELMLRDLNDPAIFDAWNNLVNSKGELEAQENAQALLDLLIRKIQP